jgi:hypothetical protein
MRIAAGVIEEQSAGGKGKLANCILRIGNDFSGYILVTGETKGYLFIVQGIIIGAVFEGVKDSFGKQALEKILWESEQNNSSIAIHNYPRVTIILEYIPEARVTKDDLSLFAVPAEEQPTEDIWRIKRMFPSSKEAERIPSTYTPLKTYLEAELREKHEKISEKLRQGYTTIPLKTKAELVQDDESRLFAEKLKTLLAQDIKEEEQPQTRPIMEKELREVLGDKLMVRTEEDEREKKKKEKVLAKVLKGAPITLKRRKFEEPITIPPEEPSVDPIEKLKEEDEMLGDAEKLFTRLNIPLSIVKRKRTEE